MKKPPAKSTIEVQGVAVSIVSERQDDYICLTDIARFKDAERTDYLISNWLRNRNTIEFLGIWERLNNPGFNPIEFDGIRIQAGLNSFILTARQWIERTGAVGIISKAGRYGAFPNILPSYGAFTDAIKVPRRSQEKLPITYRR